MKLTYWIARLLNNPGYRHYTIRTTTRKKCLERLADPKLAFPYEAPRKVTVEYDNAFDLMVTATHGFHEDDYEFEDDDCDVPIGFYSDDEDHHEDRNLTGLTAALASDYQYP